MTCARSGSAAAVRMLLARGADVNAAEPSQHQTALMWAAAERHRRRRAALLVEAGADLQAPTKKGFTALHFAAREGDLESVHACCWPPARTSTSGRSPDASGAHGPRRGAYQATLSAGSTPLLVATVRGHVPLALFLLDHGADPNAGDAGFTPLHWAVGHVGGRRLESGLRLQRSDERHPEPPGEAAAGEGAPRARRESERAHDEAAADFVRRLRGCRRAPRRSCWPAPPRTSR